MHADSVLNQMDPLLGVFADHTVLKVDDDAHFLHHGKLCFVVCRHVNVNVPH